MNPRNATLFFIILAVVIVGSLSVYLFGKKTTDVALPPPPSDNYVAPQNDQPAAGFGNLFSGFFSLPSIPPIAPVATDGQNPVTTSSDSAINPTAPVLGPNESPLKGKISLSYRNTPAYSYDYTYGSAPVPHPEQEYITIQSGSSLTEKTRVTGFTIKSSVTNTSVTVGTAAYLPFIGSVNASEDIFIGPNESVVVITGRSPIGTSFRLNKCTGYFSQYQNYYPSLRTDCPAISTEPLPPAPNNINDACLDKIDSFPTCKTFTSGEPGLTPECNNFLTKTTSYNYCVDNHKIDPNFYNKEWRVYLGRSDYLWKSRRESIELLDQNGKIIDSITY